MRYLPGQGAQERASERGRGAEPRPLGRTAAQEGPRGDASPPPAPPRAPGPAAPAAPAVGALPGGGRARFFLRARRRLRQDGGWERAGPGEGGPGQRRPAVRFPRRSRAVNMAAGGCLSTSQPVVRGAALETGLETGRGWGGAGMAGSRGQDPARETARQAEVTSGRSEGSSPDPGRPARGAKVLPRVAGGRGAHADRCGSPGGPAERTRCQLRGGEPHPGMEPRGRFQGWAGGD